MDSDSRENFENRIADWVARQGLFFQIRYSILGGGVNILAHHFLIILLKLLGIAAFGVVLVLVYLVKRPNTDKFKEGFRSTLIAHLACDGGKVDGFKHDQNKAFIRYLNLNGGQKSYFSSLEATGITFGMSIIESYKSVWDAQDISIDRFSINLKSGAETDEDARLIGDTLLNELPNFSFNTITIKSARFSWGYSERTAGSISGAQAVIKKEAKGYTVELTGGILKQNWLNHLQIKNLKIKIQRGKVIIDHAEFIPENPNNSSSKEQMESSVTFHQFKVLGGARPLFSGAIRLKSVPIDCLAASTFQPYLKGRVSGELKIGGSTNLQSGVTFEGRLSLQDKDSLTLTNALPIVSTLSLINPSANLQKITFKEGYFHLKTGEGNLEINDIYLQAPDFVEMRGTLKARRPSSKEVESMLKNREIDAEMANDISSTALDGSKEQMLNQLQISAETNKRPDFLVQPNPLQGTNKVISPFQIENEMLESVSIRNERIFSTMIFSGEMNMMFSSSMFDANSAIFQKAKLSSDKTKLQLDVPIEGKIDAVTLKQAEELLLLDDSLKKK